MVVDPLVSYFDGLSLVLERRWKQKGTLYSNYSGVPLSTFPVPRLRNHPGCSKNSH